MQDIELLNHFWRVARINIYNISITDSMGDTFLNVKIGSNVLIRFFQVLICLSKYIILTVFLVKIVKVVFS